MFLPITTMFLSKTTILWYGMMGLHRFSLFHTIFCRLFKDIAYAVFLAGSLFSLVSVLCESEKLRIKKRNMYDCLFELFL